MNDLAKIYENRFQTVLKSLAAALERQLQDYCSAEPRIDRIVARAKSVERFLTKAQTAVDGKPKYSEPLRQIQDQVGARVITFYQQDVGRIAKVIEKYYRPIESKHRVPDSQWKFGYFGLHYVLLVPTELIDSSIDRTLLPECFELQIKTLFQHAWSEANHDLGYKPDGSALNPEEERRLAFTSAQAWGADHIFNELVSERGAGSR